jgi:hypothetical protein
MFYRNFDGNTCSGGCLACDCVVTRLRQRSSTVIIFPRKRPLGQDPMYTIQGHTVRVTQFTEATPPFLESRNCPTDSALHSVLVGYAPLRFRCTRD